MGLFFARGWGGGGGGGAGGLSIILFDDGSAFCRFHSGKVVLVQDVMRFSAIWSVRARESPQALLCSLLPLKRPVYIETDNDATCLVRHLKFDRNEE